MRLRNILKLYICMIIGLLLIAGCASGKVPDEPVTPPPPPESEECEGADESEPNWDFALADILSFGVAAYGCVQEGKDNWDTWQFTLIEDRMVDISLLNDGQGDIDLALYAPDTSWLMGSGSHGAGESEYLSHRNLDAGIYYVRVEADYDSGPYADPRHYHLILKLIQEYDAYCETEPNGINNPDRFPCTYDPGYYGCITGLIADGSDEDWYFFAPAKMGVNDWEIEVVDSYWDVGKTPKMDIDSDGNPHICYFDGDGWLLKYARYDGTDWQFDIYFSFYHLNGMVLDSNDLPHVSYFWYDSLEPQVYFDYLKYAYFDGVQWHHTTIDYSPLWSEGGITLDENDHPHLAWGGDSGNLMYTYWDGSNWHEEYVYTGSAYSPAGAELDLDQAGYPHIVHNQNYSWKDASGWHTEVVDAPGNFAAMKIDSNDDIHIAYSNGDNLNWDKDLMYAFNDGSGWDVTTVDTTGDFDNADIVIDSNNHPHISYQDRPEKTLKYAHFNGNTWSNQTPDSSGDGARGTSIRMLPGDVPCIAYYCKGDLKYVKPREGESYYDYGGYLALALVGNDLTGGESLTVSMYDRSYSLLDSKTIGAGDYCTSVRLPDGVTWKQRLLIKVEGSMNSIEYDLHPLLNPTYSSSETFFETEPNNNSSSADVIPLNYDPDSDSRYLTGIFEPGDTSDDWYRFDTTESGIVMVHVSDYDIAIGNEWVNVELYDSSVSSLDSYTILHGDGSYCLNSGGVVPAGTYYVRMATNTWPHRYVIEPIFVGR